MLKEGISRRQFVGGAAAVAAAAAMPVLTNAAPAVATPTNTFPVAAAAVTPWVPLVPLTAARYALEIYRGKFAPQGG